MEQQQYEAAELTPEIIYQALMISRSYIANLLSQARQRQPWTQRYVDGGALIFRKNQKVEINLEKLWECATAAYTEHVRNHPEISNATEPNRILFPADQLKL